MNQNDFAFSDFANNKFYSAVNKTLIELADLSNEKRVVDLACGTGMVTRQIANTLKDAKDFVEGVLCREDSPYKVLAEHKKISMIKFVRQQAQFIEELNEENDALRRELSLLIELSSLKYRDRGFSREIRNLSPCGLTRLLTLVKKSNIDTDDIESYVDELVRLES